MYLWASCQSCRGLTGRSKTELLIKLCEVSFFRRALEYQLDPHPYRYEHQAARPRPGHLFPILRSNDQGRWSSYLAWVAQPELINVCILTAEQLLPFSIHDIQEVLGYVKANKDTELPEVEET